MTKNQVENIIRDINKTLKEVLENSFLGKPINNQFIDSIKFTSEKYIEHLFNKYGIIDSARKNVRYNVKVEGDFIVVEPENLYTLLLMNGIYVYWEDVWGKEEWETELGTYVFKNNQSYFNFKPKQPLTYINITFKMDSEEELRKL